MDYHRDSPPPPPNLRHTTTSQILRQTHHSLIDNDPSLKSILSHLDFSASSHHHVHHHLTFRRRRAFLYLSRVGTLDDDFFSGDSNFDRSLSSLL
ncbi:transmembrane protein [Perilla frutescens var. frutescens]|nr:transmembrane protein [Perilla frutescens var. frutescens]